MIVKGTLNLAFRTRPLRSRRVSQINVHFAFLQIEVDPVHLPRLSNPQNLRVKIFVLHSPIIGTPTKYPDEPVFLTH